MLPLLSRLSVRYKLENRLRHWCSSTYLRISPLLVEFRFLRLPSRNVVSNAVPGLSPGISRPTYGPVYVPFTPTHSEQRLHPPYYRGCWHGVSRCFLFWYRQTTGVLTQLPFFPAERALQPKGLLHSRGVAASGFPPLCNIPHCCLP